LAIIAVSATQKLQQMLEKNTIMKNLPVGQWRFLYVALVL